VALKFVFPFALLVVAAASLLSTLPARQASPGSFTATVTACGGAAIDTTISDDDGTISHDIVLNWIRRAATAVCTYYGKYPVHQLTLHVHVSGREGVHHGVTFPHGDGALIRISVGPSTTAADLDSDWTLTHEMIHPAFPYMTEKHHWIEEGIAVYVEPIARVQAGQLSATKMWNELVRDMPQGEPQPGDEGMDRTHTWGRTYWGGAMFCLVADVRIREQTNNRKGLQDALRAILDTSGGIDHDWTIEHAFAAGDKATGTTVLTDLYNQMRDQPAPVDLAALWQRLGIERKPDGSIEFVDSAPLANIREAITRPQQGAPSRKP